MQASMKKFYQNIFFPTLQERDIKRIVCAGDFGDRRKYWNVATSRFVYEEYVNPCKMLGIRQDILLGNHDLFYRNSTNVSGVQELYRAEPNWIRVHAHPKVIDIDGLGVLLLPWIVEETYKESLDLIKTTTAPVVMGHLEFTGFQMYRGMENREGMSPELFQRFELVMSGHFHHRSRSGNIVYLGAPYPMIWSDYNDPRGFHLFDTATKELTFIENPYTVFNKIIYDDEGKKHDYIKGLVQSILAPDSNYHDAYVKVICKSRTQPYWYDLMMDALGKVNAQDVIVVDDITANEDDEDDSVETQDVDTPTLIREFVDSLTINCDKDELNKYLQAKYLEAQTLSQSGRIS